MTDNPIFNFPDTLVISGADETDETFSGEFGGRYLTFNVTKAWKDCQEGKHGKPYLFDVEPAYWGNRRVEVDPDKVERFMNLPEVMTIPTILVIEMGAAWMIDGHHRLRALYRLGAPEFLGYVIEEPHRDQYLVRFNGKAEMPKNFLLPTIFGKGDEQ